MIKLMLNLHKLNNYAFFCPISKLHLTVSNPVGYTNEVTSAILRGLKTKAILDVDNVINLETGTVENKAVVDDTVTIEESKEDSQSTVSDNAVPEPIVENIEEVVETQENTKTSTKGRKKSASKDAE